MTYPPWTGRIARSAVAVVAAAGAGDAGPAC